MRKAAQLSAFAMLLPLLGCDEPAVITHVDRRSDMVLDEIWKLQDDRGLPVEIHGSPFRRVTDAALTAALAVPPEAPQDVRFYLTPTGGPNSTHEWRIVLHFNPQGPPNAARDCALTGETRTNPLPERGFSMNFVVCQGRDWKAHGFLTVSDIDDGDLAAFTDHFKTLISTVFRAENDH